MTNGSAGSSGSVALRFPVLVFDFDGTLIESAPELTRCLNRLLDGHGRRVLAVEEVELMIGIGVATLVERGFAATGTVPADLDEQVKRFVRMYHDAPIEGTPVYDGVVATLETLQAAGHVMGVCTNKLYRPTMKILDGLGLSRFFTAVAGGDTFPVRKPDPGHLLGVLAQLGADPAQAVMIGDSDNDIGCARAAGVRAVAVTYGYTKVPHAEFGADLLIDRFDALPQALARLAETAPA